VVPASKLNLKHHLLDGYVITNNDPQIGYISWSDLHIVYEGTTYDIDDGNTNLRYIWWDLSSPTVLQCTNTVPTPYSLVIFEDCEDAWNELVDPDVTSEIDVDDKKAGAASLKLTVGADAAAGDILATEAKASFNITGYEKVFLWIKTSVAVSAGDLQLLLDDTPECASPIKSLDIPALEADTWTKVGIDLGDASGLTAVVSVGLKMVVDKGAFTVHLDEVYAFGPGTLTEDDCVLFINMDGICFTLPNTYVIDGSLIIPESIYTNALRTHCVTSEKILANSILSMHIGVDELSAITANLGTVTAGLIKSFDEKMQLDLNNNILTLQDANDYFRVKLGLMGGDYGIKIKDASDDLMLSSGETMALSAKYVDKLRDYLQGSGYITPTDKGASSAQAKEDEVRSNSGTAYSSSAGGWVEKGSTGNISCKAGSDVKVEVSLKAQWSGIQQQYAAVKVALCDSAGNIKESYWWQRSLTTYKTFERTFDLSTYFSEGENYKIRRWLRGGIDLESSSFLAYTNVLKVTELGEGYNAPKENTVDEPSGTPATFWEPDPSNEAGAWVSWDLGMSRSVDGCKFYWGAAEAYRPTDYKVYTSPDNSDWTEKAHQEGDPGASAWKEHSWTKVAARYIKFEVQTDGHGASGTKLYEAKIRVVDEGFLGLSDTPSNYANDGEKIVAVNAGEDALAFVSDEQGALIEMDTSTDVISYYTVSPSYIVFWQIKTYNPGKKIYWRVRFFAQSGYTAYIGIKINDWVQLASTAETSPTVIQGIYHCANLTGRKTIQLGIKVSSGGAAAYIRAWSVSFIGKEYSDNLSSG